MAMIAFHLFITSACIFSLSSLFSAPLAAQGASPFIGSSFDDAISDRVEELEEDLEQAFDEEPYLSWKDQEYDEPLIDLIAEEDLLRTGSVPVKPLSDQFRLHSRLQVGANYTRVYLDPHGSSHFDGNLGGLQGLYEYVSDSHFYAAAKLAWRQGDTKGSEGKRDLLYIDTQERVGYALECKRSDMSFTFFSGLGYRFIEHTFDPHNEDSTRYKYNEFYVPVGVLSEYGVNPWFTFGINFTWMPQIFPTVSIDPLNGAHWNLTHTLNNYFVEVPFDFTLSRNQRCHLIITPFYEHWKDGHSTAKTTGGVALGLPGNTYNFWGVDVNFGYCF